MRQHLPIVNWTAYVVLSFSPLLAHGQGDDTDAASALVLNELLASNRSGKLDDEGETSDWIELRNMSDRPLRLGGYRLTDDPQNMTKWTLPDHRVLAGGHYVVWMSGLNRTSLTAEAFTASATTIPFQMTLVEHGTDWKFFRLLPGGNPSQPGWTASDFDDSKFTVGPAGFGYGDDDDATELPVGTTAVLLRHEFTLDQPLTSDSLVLEVDYDDGFAAYLNGTRVAAVNARDGEPRADDLATGSHEAGAPERFDISAHVGLLRPGRNVIAVAGLNISRGSTDMSIKVALGTLPPVSHASFRLNKRGGTLYLVAPNGTIADQIQYPQQTPDQTLGRSASTPSEWGYFLTPTPGAANTGPRQRAPVKSRVSFSPKPGASEAGVEIVINEESSSDVHIRFTTDGSDPAPTSPTFSEPIKLDKTAVFRAAAFVGAERVSPVASATYLIGPRPKLPVVSVSMKPEDFIDIHLQKAGRGRGGERPAFLELFNPAGKREVATGFGLRLHGGAGRRGGLEVKKSYRGYFRRAYGVGRLDHPIIPHAGVEDFDKLVFRANFGDGRSGGAYIRDQVIRDLHLDMGGVASNGWWCVMLINSADHGVYNVCERMDEEFFISHLGPGSYDVIKTGETVLSGSRAGWDELRDYIRGTDFSIKENYEQLARRVDIENFTAYVILNFWAQNFDWPHNNWYAARRVPDGKWIFLCWDAEWGFWGGPHRENDDPYAFIDSGGAYGYGLTRSLFFALLGSPDYCNYYQQQVERHLNGALSKANVMDQIRRHRDAIAVDIEHEFETRKYDKERWRREIVQVEEFTEQRGRLFQKYTDEYFSRREAASGEDRVALIEDVDGRRRVIYRAADGAIRELTSAAGDKWRDAAVSELAKSPKSLGRPSVYSLAPGDRRVLYRGESGGLHELKWTGGADATWRHLDLTSHVNIRPAGRDPTVVVADGVPHIAYVDNTGRAREVWFDGDWRHHPLPAAPLPESEVVISRTGSNLHVTYRTRFGAPCEQTLSLDRATDERRSWSPRIIHRLPAQGRPLSFSSNGNRQIIFWAAETWPHGEPFIFLHRFRGPKYGGPRHALVHSWHDGERFWRLEPIGQPADLAAGNPCVVHDVKQDIHHLAFRDKAGHVREATLRDGEWRITDPTAAAKSPLAAGEPAGLVSARDGARYYVYRGRDDHLHELRFDGDWTHRDLTDLAAQR
ncbi:MAG: CotH kinase family protein [Pirellulaceae bacterium]|nr:CotH kinase family protein [Pirellulaceae bacterium]